MAPPPSMEEEGAEGHVKDPKNGSFGEETTVRRPGRLRVVHPGVAEFLRSPPRRLWRTRRPTPPTSPRAEDEGEEGGRARYDCAFEDEEEEEREAAGLFAPPQLVWAKVRSHPWWPGQVFDPADASELARRQQRPLGALLVAHFWDKSFAWVDAAALRPFRAGFRRFAAQRQGALSAFAASVDAALAEVARRVDAGLSCSCACRGNVSATAVSKKQQVVDNAGVRDGAHGAAVDAAFARRAFRGEAFLGYVCALATAPMAGAERVDLAIATAQLKAFSRWRGCSGDLPEYTYFHGIDGVATSSARKARKRRSRSGAGGVDASGRGKKMSRCSRATRGNESEDDVDLELEDLSTFPEPTSPQVTTKMGILMNRAAKQMSRSPVVVLRASGNGNAAAPKEVSHMARCASAVDELPPVNTIGAPADKDDRTCTVPSADDERVGLVLNFSRASAVPSPTDLTTIDLQSVRAYQGSHCGKCSCSGDLQEAPGRGGVVCKNRKDQRYQRIPHQLPSHPLTATCNSRSSSEEATRRRIPCSLNPFSS